MVHALKEIYRVLVAGGYLADLRPDRGTALSGSGPSFPEAVVSSAKGSQRAGVLEKEDLEVHRAASTALRRVLRTGVFSLISSATFPFYWYFSSLSLLEAYLQTRWDTTVIDRRTHRRLKELMRSNPAAEILIKDRFQLNVLRKV
jgi:hypothetical protein